MAREDFELSNPFPNANQNQLLSMAAIAIGVVFIGFIAWKAAFTVKEYEQAVVLRFGEFHKTVGNGLHFKVPGVDERVIVDMSENSMRLPWGFEERTGDEANVGRKSTDDQSLLLTGDLYAAVVEWNVVWRVVDPEKFIFSFNEDHVRDALIAISRSSMHRIVGDYSADETLTSKREEIAQFAFEEMREAVERFNCGIEITTVQLQRVTPPDVVKPSFDQVNASIQTKAQLINEANRERFGLINMAEAERDKLIREAEGYSSRRIAEAEGEIAALQAKYQSYKLAPEITRQRMYLETMERVFQAGGKKLIIDEELPGAVPLLQLSGQ